MASGLLALDGGLIEFRPPTAVDVVFPLVLAGLMVWTTLQWTVLRGWLQPSRRRQLAFDRQVYGALTPLSRFPEHVPGVINQEQLQRLRLTRQQAIDELANLKAPTAEWAAVRDAYVELIQDELGLMPRDPSPSEVEAFRMRAAEIQRRASQLRAVNQGGAAR